MLHHYCQVILDVDINPDDILEEERIKIARSMQQNVYVQIPMQHPFQVESEIVTEFTIENMDKYAIFRDLWLKGFFITSGESFGSDFLTYPGDPMYYHASQIVHVINKSHRFDATYLISCSRLSVSVNKKCVFAYTNDDGSVTYQTLSWDNPKLNQLYSTNPEKNCETGTMEIS